MMYRRSKIVHQRMHSHRHRQNIDDRTETKANDLTNNEKEEKVVAAAAKEGQMKLMVERGRRIG